MSEKSRLSPEQRLDKFEKKMRDAEISEDVICLFESYYRLLEHGHKDSQYLWEKDIQPVQKGEICDYRQLTSDDAELGRELLDQSVVFKLNGGLGTTMGMPYAKSLLKVKSGYTFLDIVLLQTGEGQFSFDPGSLVLMNSFNTHEDTINYLYKKGFAEKERPFMFLQHKYPKILAESLEPALAQDNQDLEWNPPGHGDLYAALFVSGILDKLLDYGKRYAFISNADNLGADIDPHILGYFAQNRLMFLMEVAQRTPSDKKGGHLAEHKNDHQLVLREIAQCPNSELENFQDISRYQFFNTNNIWLDLKQLRSHIVEKGLPKLPLIVNTKSLDPRDESTSKVYQLETALGSAISVFKNTGAIEVNRCRFIPVKKTNDLLAIRSDLYMLTDDFRLIPNPVRPSPEISIDLDSNFYKKIDQFDQRFPYGSPSLVECQSLQVQGDVVFEDHVICKKGVRIFNKTGTQKKITSGRVLTGEVVF
ncbi:MAG TPA: UTP--glucose-1-phosphate uridylyltransferase [Desulfohalobiaceae bacterium]|nr:UTP--glucose-1-phosphate uridylyltransferase [Desulfohalobiaceae bacterium]